MQQLAFGIWVVLMQLSFRSVGFFLESAPSIWTAEECDHREVLAFTSRAYAGGCGCAVGGCIGRAPSLSHSSRKHEEISVASRYINIFA